MRLNFKRNIGLYRFISYLFLRFLSRAPHVYFQISNREAFYVSQTFDFARLRKVCLRWRSLAVAHLPNETQPEEAAWFAARIEKYEQKATRKAVGMMFLFYSVHGRRKQNRGKKSVKPPQAFCLSPYLSDMIAIGDASRRFGGEPPAPSSDRSLRGILPSPRGVLIV